MSVSTETRNGPTVTLAERARRVAELELSSRQRRDIHEFLGRVDKTPASHTVKGMYVGGVIAAMKSMDVPYPTQRIQAFKDYPLRDFMALLLEAAVMLYPGKTVGGGLRALGEQAIPTFAQSIAGGVIMATVGHSWELALRMVSRGYEVSLKPGRATVAEMGRNDALVQLRDVWNFGDTYQAGVITGLMHWCRIEGTITPTVFSAGDTDLRIEWA